MAAPHDGEVQIRLIEPGDDLGAQVDLAERAFGAKSPADRDSWLEIQSYLISQRRCLGAFVDSRPVGGAAFHDMRQWWCGRAVPMAGVASVRVAPEERGRGIGRQLMTALLDEIAAHGYPLSALYPATMSLYRSLGWELAGSRYTAVIPGRSLFRLMPPDPAAAEPGSASTGSASTGSASTGSASTGSAALRRAGPADAAEIDAVMGRVHEAARDCGPITWGPEMLGRWLALSQAYTYLCDDGFLVYRWHDGNRNLMVNGVEAVSPATVRAFWSHLGGYSSVADKVYAQLGPADALWWLTQERDASQEHRAMWMLRVIDAPAAVAARGFPAVISLTVPLLITDDMRPANSGSWDLTVAGGKGSLTPSAGGPGQVALVLGSRGLAALYAGTPVVTLRQAGLASGGSPEHDAGLDAAFAATPYMLDDF